jgi:hypothetical protein
MPLVGTLAAVSARGFGLGTEDMFGEQTFTTPGTYTFYVPAGVTALTMVAIGGGGGGARGARYIDFEDPTTFTAYSPYPGALTNNWYSGGGGGLAYKNSASVSPGQALTVFVGDGGQGGISGGVVPGEDSYVANSGGTKIVHAGGGSAGTSGTGGAMIVGDGGGAGGNGANWQYSGSSQPEEQVCTSAGGGGAGGYSGAGGAGGSISNNGSSGSGGAAGGGGGGRFGSFTSSGGTIENWQGNAGAAGGGTGLYGVGSSGAGGAACPSPVSFGSNAIGGGGGSGGSNGGDSSGVSAGSNDSTYGVYGGGGAVPGNRVRRDVATLEYTCSNGFTGDGQNGAVRIIWTTNPTITRAFPSTNVGQL